MVKEKIIEAAVEALEQKLRHSLEEVPRDTLTPELAEQVSQGLQQSIRHAALAGYRTFLASYEVHEKTIEGEGERLRLKQASEKTFLTPFGEMTLCRNLYQADGGGSAYVPLDAQWGMVGEYATPEVQDSVLFGVAHLTPKEVACLLKKSSLFQPSEQAIKNLVKKAGTFIEAHGEELNEAMHAEEDVPSETQVLVASMDGVNVLLREKGQKAGRPKERPGGERDAEAISAYRNAMVGSISFYGTKENEDGDVEPVRLRSHYLARMPESHFPTFKAQFETELDQGEERMGKEVTKVLLNDGHRTLWNYIDRHARFAAYEKLIDFYHTTEHLSHAAEALFGKTSDAAKAWYAKWHHKLLEEDHAALGVIRSMEYYAKKLNLPQGRSEDLEKEHTFFRRNHPRMTYAQFIRRGWPIGSGPVEAAAKSGVKTRMGRRGMRWSRQGGQHILPLRAYAKAERWDRFWKNYQHLKRAA